MFGVYFVVFGVLCCFSGFTEFVVLWFDFGYIGFDFVWFGVGIRRNLHYFVLVFGVFCWLWFV